MPAKIEDIPGLGRLYAPAGHAAVPHVLALHGSEGVWSGFAHLQAAIFAASGIAALPFGYSVGGNLWNAGLIENVPLDRTAAALNTLRSRPRSTGKVGVYGVSRGAEHALLARGPDGNRQHPACTGCGGCARTPGRDMRRVRRPRVERPRRPGLAGVGPCAASMDLKRQFRSIHAVPADCKRLVSRSAPDQRWRERHNTVIEDEQAAVRTICSRRSNGRAAAFFRKKGTWCRPKPQCFGMRKSRASLCNTWHSDAGDIGCVARKHKNRRHRVRSVNGTPALQSTTSFTQRLPSTACAVTGKPSCSVISSA